MHIPWEHIGCIQFQSQPHVLLWKSTCKLYSSSPSHHCSSINEILLFTSHMFPAEFPGQPNKAFMVSITTGRAGIWVSFFFFPIGNFVKERFWKCEATWWHSMKLQKWTYNFSLKIVTLKTFWRKLPLIRKLVSYSLRAL